MSSFVPYWCMSLPIGRHVAVTASDLISQSRTSLEHKIADSYKAISAVESRLGVQNDQVQQIEFLVRSFESAVRR